MVPSSISSPVVLFLSDKCQQNVYSQVHFESRSKNCPEYLDSVSDTKNIYVCSFCQVFSPNQAVVSRHIVSSHSESFPHGANPDDFVSKLAALDEAREKPKRKKDQHKKQDNRFQPDGKRSENIEPIPRPGDLFWCKNCLRSFKKSRQLMQHICMETFDQGSLSEELLVESEDDDFKSHIDIDRVPWSRRKLGGCAASKSSNSQLKKVVAENNFCTADNNIITSKVVPNWRADPSYVHLFQDQDEKAAFEAHLKSIDYSCIDNLFRAEEKKCRTNKKNIQSRVYSCVCCRKVSKSLSHMRLHCLTHTDFKPFSCPKCSYCTNAKGSLYVHMRKHTGNMFHCSVCDFKSPKRAHLLDHEATHSSIPQICKLCKNSYKTQRSLVAHVKKYHSNPVGKRYFKSLTSKATKNILCSLCKKKFKSPDLMKIHNQICHENDVMCNETKLNSSGQTENMVDSDKILELPLAKTLEQSDREVLCHDIRVKDPLADIVLNNLLHGEHSDGITFNTVFAETPGNMLLNFPANSIPQLPSTTVLEECSKTLNLSVLDQCLQSTDFTGKCVEEFRLQTSLPNGENHAAISSSHSSVLDEIAEDKVKPAEIKLFEKCTRAPAYVCCVCSAIYICSTTLKAHLKEHVNSTSSSAIIDPPTEQFEASKITATNSDLDKVCEILQNSAEPCSYNEELEKLYTSSLDMMWYLPEVSVVLQNDPALIDSVLDDISNFPLNDGDPPDDLDDKDAHDSVLKCFL